MLITRLLFRFLFTVALTLLTVTALALPQASWQATLSSAIANRRQGNIDLSVGLFTRASQLARTDREKMIAEGELGATLLQARRLEQAQTPLHNAYTFFTGSERARYALDLGNLATLRKQLPEAQRYYEEAQQLSGDDPEVYASAALNLTRLLPASEKRHKLAAISEKIAQVDDPVKQIPLYLNLGNQARMLGQTELAYQSLQRGQQIAGQADKNRFSVEVLDAMAQLYEDQGRKDEALALTQQAVADANALSPSAVADILITLEWRQGRLYRALGNAKLALAAFERAVTHIEAIRLDIPIDYDDGRSSFRATLEPVYLGLVDLLLQAADKETVTANQAYLRRVVNTVEWIKQSELQDYLGDRCTVEIVKGGASGIIPPKTAILYPIIFDDRLELLLETKAGLTRKSVSVQGVKIREIALAFAGVLRNGQDFHGYASQLYDWLLRPFDKLIADQHIDTLVVVPDGALRLVAMGALHDGNVFAIEKYAVTTVTGLSMTNTSAPPVRRVSSLVAGVSEFGPVVDKLSQARIGQMTDLAGSIRPAARGINLRALRTSLAAAQLDSKPDSVSRANALRESLALPGVKQEIESVGAILPGVSMLNAAFTVDGFRHEAESGAYRMVHIASHGIFGGTADTSYILAYDDLLTLNGLQSLLKADQFRKNPIELLSLSACETAQGNDRAPLGISGAATKARAKSVLGTLWPVEDNAARTLMENFYKGLVTAHLTKAQSLRQAQVGLIHREEFSHPFFWAPFVLIGNWL